METSLKIKINWHLLCRICLKSSDLDMKYIFSEPCLSGDIVTKIIKCGGIPVDIIDGMPERICNQCLLDLDAAYRFRNVCQESYHKLYQILTNEEKAQTEFKYNQKDNLKKQEDDDINLSIPFKVDLHRNSCDQLYLSEDSLFKEELEQEFEELKSESKPKQLELQFPNAKDPLFEESGKNVIKKLKKGRPTNPTSTYICYCCGNIYKSQSKLSQHIKLHSAEKSHECEICKKKFAQAAQLSRHMNSHTGNRPYKCKFCPSRFADPSTCIKHERIHTNTRPFKCLECGKSFTYSNVLKVHQKIHTGEKPFSCSVCDKTFTQLHHKKSHERTHSGCTITKGQSIKKRDSIEI